MSLQFGRDAGVRYRYVAQDQLSPASQGVRLEGWEAWVVVDRLLYVTEQPDDSQEARLVRVKVDSSRAGVGGAVTYGPFPGFVGQFDGRRERIDTVRREADVESLRELVFRGTVPLPAKPLAVGESWTAEVPRFVEHEQQPVPPGWDRMKGTVKRIRIVDHDTLADLGLSLHISGGWAPPKDVHPRDILGELNGTETFSVSHGVTVHLALQGRLEVYASNLEIFALNEVVTRDLLP